eukprot:756577-Pyramimonas_sp.AAC.1
MRPPAPAETVWPTAGATAAIELRRLGHAPDPWLLKPASRSSWPAFRAKAAMEGAARSARRQE